VPIVQADLTRYGEMDDGGYCEERFAQCDEIEKAARDLHKALAGACERLETETV
jgi:hypothetical protein